jgi:hypothetical protein
MSDGPDIFDREQAAVGACEGVPTEVLQPGLVKDLISAVRQCYQRHGVPETEACTTVATRLRQLDALQGVLVPADYPGDLAPPLRHTHWRLLAAWLPLPLGAAMNIVAYGLGMYHPVEHDSLNPEHFPGWLASNWLTWFVGVVLTVRGLWRFKSESDGAFVWRAMFLQFLTFMATIWLYSALR